MLFIVSAVVTLVGAYYNWYQANAYEKAYGDRFKGLTDAFQQPVSDVAVTETPDAMPDDPTARLTERVSDGASGEVRLPSGLTPTTIRGWIDRATDSAANFPATILTVVALQEEERFASTTAQIGLLLVAVVMAVGFMSRIGPKYANGRTVLKLSVWSLVLVVVNVVAFVVSES